MRYDWSAGGNPRRALATRIAGWVLLVAAGFDIPRLLWLAATRDWTLALLALTLAVGVVAQRLMLRRMYGVREPVKPAEPQKTHAERVAEAVEAQRQRQWDAIAERAYRARGGVRRPTPAPASKPPLTAMPPTASMTTMADFTVGIARLAAAMGGCAHPDAEPVDLITGERVAWVCPACPAELPADWA